MRCYCVMHHGQPLDHPPEANSIDERQTHRLDECQCLGGVER